MTIRQVFPAAGDVDVESVLALLKRRWIPFSPPLIDCCADISSALMADREARQFPELQALAFWLRKAAVVRLANEFAELQSRECLLTPRGLVFHIPPSNVDTIFLYSWALAFLTGNSSIVRLSGRKSLQSTISIRILEEVLAASTHADLSGGSVLVEYGHDPAITAAISAAVDVRVIWGGDETIRRIRDAPIAPHAKDLGFPDRSSLAAFNAAAWLELAPEAKQDLVERFFNDTYWFHQMACSSPRIVAWSGEASLCAAASREFWLMLRDRITRKNYALPLGAYLKKLAFACGAILDYPDVCEYSEYGNELTLLTLKSLRGLRRSHCGGGLLFQVFIRQIGDLAEWIARPDQTLSAFGFTRDVMCQFAAGLNGAGIDRIVPIGSALQFSRFWDGYDLLQELTRRVYIESSGNA